MARTAPIIIIAEMSTWWQVLYVHVQAQIQVLTPQVQVPVQVLQNCTRVQLEYKYTYQVLHLWWRHI